MAYFSWNIEKNDWLKELRGFTFEKAVFLIENGGLLDVVAHPISEKYPDQKMFILEFENYVYLIPFVESDDEIFLKTIIPRRKATRKYLGES
ncbi:MAG: toxin [Thiotrichales bacterium]